MPTRTITGIFLDPDGDPIVNRDIRVTLKAFFAVDGTRIAVPVERVITPTASDGGISVDLVVPATGTAQYEVKTPKGTFRVNVGDGAPTTFAALLAAATTPAPQSAILTALDAHVTQLHAGLLDGGVPTSVAGVLTLDAGTPTASSSGAGGGDGNADTLDGQDSSYYLSRSHHTGTQAISTVSGLQEALDALDSGGDAATLQGQAGAHYLSRANHTGAQAISTVTGLQTALDGKALAADLDAEATARALADAALGGRVTTLEGAPPAHGHLIGDVAGLQGALDGKVVEGDARLSNARTPTGGAGGVLGGTYPNPSFAVDMATQAELDSHATTTTSHGITAAGAALTTAASAAAQRTALALGTAAQANTGTGASDVPTITQADARYQPLDSDLTALAALATTAYGRSLLEAANAAALRTLAGLVIGTNVQAHDAELQALAGLASAADTVPYFTGAGAAALATLTAFARTLLDDVDAAAARTTLGLGTAATSNTSAFATPADLAAHEADTTAVHGIANTANLLTTTSGLNASNVTAGTLDPARGGQVVQGRAKGGGTTVYTVPGIEWISTNTRGLTANRVHYAPMPVETPVTIDQFALEVTTGVSGTARVGVYNADTDWQPTSLVLDAGTVDVTSTGVKTITLGSALALPVGRYVIALNTNAAISVRTWRGGGKFFGLLPALGSNSFTILAYASQTYAAFPSTGLAWDTPVAGAAPNDHMVLCRVSVP